MSAKGFAHICSAASLPTALASGMGADAVAQVQTILRKRILRAFVGTGLLACVCTSPKTSAPAAAALWATFADQKN